MIDYVAAIRRESARFHDAVAGADLAGRVPSCPGWSIADLVWHLTEVQHAWGAIAAGLLQERSEVADLERPADDLLVGLLATKSAALADALEARDPSDACWSWHEDGRTVGWVRRRQAHEALIHRVDAELAVGGATARFDPELAEDGVDEIVSLFLDASDLPEWAAFESSGRRATLRVDGGTPSWNVELGMFRGTSPVSGNSYDEEAIRLIEDGEATTVITGSAEDLDRWLWGRGSLDALRIDGDEADALWIRSAAVHATQ